MGDEKSGLKRSSSVNTDQSFRVVSSGTPAEEYKSESESESKSKSKPKPKPKIRTSKTFNARFPLTPQPFVPRSATLGATPTNLIEISLQSFENSRQLGKHSQSSASD